MICEYGCGQEAKYYFKYGNRNKGSWCCSNNPAKCPFIKKKATYTRTEDHKKEMSKALRGRIFSETHRKNISLAQKKRFKNLEERNKCINNGKQRRTCKDCGKSISHKGRCNDCYRKWNRGKKHWNWKGGKKKIIYSSTFTDKKLREEIRKEFPYCLGCVLEGKSIEGNCLHHIDYDKSNDTKGNLLWLCRSHHASTNFDRKFFKKFLSNFKKSPRPKVLGIDIRGGEL